MGKYKKLKYRHFDDIGNKNYNNRVLTLKLSSWEDFQNVVGRFNNCPDYIWRGQRCEAWKLKSTFDRKFSSIRNRSEELGNILKVFKQRLSDIPKDIDISEEDKIWAIGQNYGLPTPLLDWTECPYTSAYFAFYKGAEDPKKNRVIYALNRAAKRLILKIKDSKSKEVLSKERFVKFPDIKDSSDEIQNERLKAQKGKFTKALDGNDIKVSVERLSKKGKYKGKVILAEILLPGEIRGEFMERLEFMKITHGALFPDFAGAVMICKLGLNLE